MSVEDIQTLKDAGVNLFPEQQLLIKNRGLSALTSSVFSRAKADKIQSVLGAGLDQGLTVKNKKPDILPFGTFGPVAPGQVAPGGQLGVLQIGENTERIVPGARSGEPFTFTDINTENLDLTSGLGELGTDIGRLIPTLSPSPDTRLQQIVAESVQPIADPTTGLDSSVFDGVRSVSNLNSLLESLGLELPQQIDLPAFDPLPDSLTGTLTNTLENLVSDPAQLDFQPSELTLAGKKALDRLLDTSGQVTDEEKLSFLNTREFPDLTVEEGLTANDKRLLDTLTQQTRDALAARGINLSGKGAEIEGQITSQFLAEISDRQFDRNLKARQQLVTEQNILFTQEIANRAEDRGETEALFRRQFDTIDRTLRQGGQEFDQNVTAFTTDLAAKLIGVDSSIDLMSLLSDNNFRQAEILLREAGLNNEAIATVLGMASQLNIAGAQQSLAKAQSKADFKLQTAGLKLDRDTVNAQLAQQLNITNAELKSRRDEFQATLNQQEFEFINKQAQERGLAIAELSVQEMLALLNIELTTALNQAGIDERAKLAVFQANNTEKLAQMGFDNQQIIAIMGIEADERNAMIAADAAKTAAIFGAVGSVVGVGAGVAAGSFFGKPTTPR